MLAEYSASRFFQDARAATELVLARNNVPIVVGGTCTYLRRYGHHRPPAQAFTGVGALVKMSALSVWELAHCSVVYGFPNTRDDVPISGT